MRTLETSILFMRPSFTIESGELIDRSATQDVRRCKAVLLALQRRYLLNKIFLFPNDIQVEADGTAEYYTSLN